MVGVNESKVGKESEIYKETAVQFEETIKDLYRIQLLISALATHGSAVVEMPQIEGPPKHKLVSWYDINEDGICLELKGVLNALFDPLYPRIRSDQNYKELVEFLGKYRKHPSTLERIKFKLKHPLSSAPKVFYYLSVLEKIAENIPPLRSKLRLLLSGLKGVDNGITKLEEMDPEKIIGPLIPFAKPTEDLSNYIKEIKILIGDSNKTQWYQYRRVLFVFTDALMTFGINDYFPVAESMLDTFNDRYEDDSYLHLTDLNRLRRFLHETEDRIESYKERTKSVI